MSQLQVRGSAKDPQRSWHDAMEAFGKAHVVVDMAVTGQRSMATISLKTNVIC